VKHSHGTRRCKLDDVRVSGARLAMTEMRWRHDLVEVSDLMTVRLAHNAVERLAIEHKLDRTDVATATSQGKFVAKALCGEYQIQNRKGDWVDKMPEVFEELNDKVNMDGQKKRIEKLLEDLVPEDHAEIAAEDRDVEEQQVATETTELAALRAEVIAFREIIAELKDLKAAKAGIAPAARPSKKAAKKKAKKKRGKKKT